MPHQQRQRSLIILGLVGLIGLGLWWWQWVGQTSPQQSPATSEQASGVSSISPQEFDQLSQQESAFVLDVHTPEQTHIPGTDAFIPFDQLSDNQAQLPADKNTPLLVYCRSGSMSAQAGQELAAMGYTQVYDLTGGLNAYREQRNQITFWPESQDLGTVIYGEVATAEFTLTNLTPLPLTVTRVSTSCSCTSAEVENKQLSAYDATTVRVSFNPAVHGDETDLGDLTRTIYLETDNPNFAQLTTQIKAQVVKSQ